MELLRIEGSRADLLALREFPDVQVVASSAIDRGDGSWLVSAYAPERPRRTGCASAGWSCSSSRAPSRSQARGDAGGGRAGRVSQLRCAVRAPAAACERASGGVRARGAPAPHARGTRGAHAARREHRCAGHGRRASAACTRASGRHPTRCSRWPRAWSARTPRAARWSIRTWVDQTARPPITYGAWSVPAADVKRIVEGVALVLVPLVNPDGRDFSFAGTDELHYMWRKNRRPAAAGHTGPWCRRRRPQSQLRHRLGLRALLQPGRGRGGAIEQGRLRPADLHRPRGRVRTRDAQRAVRRGRAAALAFHGRALLLARDPVPLGHGRRPGPRAHPELPEPRLGPLRRPSRSRRSRRRLRRVPAVGAGRRACRDRAAHARRHPRPGRLRPHGAPPLDVHRQTGARPLPHHRDLRRLLRGAGDARRARTRAPTPSAWNAESTRRPTTRTTTRAASTPTTARSSRRSNARSTPRSWRSRRRRWSRDDRGHRRTSSSTLRTLVAGRPSSVSSAGSVTANSPRRAAWNMPRVKSASSGGSPRAPPSTRRRSSPRG